MAVSPKYYKKEINSESYCQFVSRNIRKRRWHEWGTGRVRGRGNFFDAFS